MWLRTIKNIKKGNWLHKAHSPSKLLLGWKIKQKLLYKYIDYIDFQITEKSVSLIGCTIDDIF